MRTRNRFSHGASSKAISTLGCAIAWATQAHAQQVVLDLRDDWDFGYAVNAAVDFDHDGLPDIAIGKPQQNPCHGGTGKAQVRSCKTGALLHAFVDSTWFAHGYDVESAGDVNADGFLDLIYAAPDNFPDCPYFDFSVVRSGNDGSIVFEKGMNAGTFNDVAACGIGDVNNDGYADVAFADANSGKVILYSGKTHAALKTLQQISMFGSDIADVGDIDLDGLPDFAISNETAANNGTVQLFSATMTPITTITGLTPGERFGFVLDGIGDIDLDGHPDILAGAPKAAPNGVDSGAARQISGLTFGIVKSFNGSAPNQRFGQSVTRLVDFDRDGRTDFAVGSLGGFVRAFSGPTGNLIATIGANGVPGSFGAAVDGSGDLDGDGLGELVIGSPAAMNQPSGTVVVRSCLAAIDDYGAGCPGSGGFIPKLLLAGCPIPNGSLTLVLTNGLGGATTILLFGTQQGSTPLPNGCTLLVSPLLPLTLQFGLTGAGPGQGSIAFGATLPSTVTTAEFTMQAFVLDPGAAGGYCSSNGIAIEIQ